MKKTLLILITGLAFTFLADPIFAVEETVQIHGFISQGYISTTENNFIADSEDGTFKFHEMGLNFGQRLTSGLHIGIQFLAKDFGETGNNEIKIDWALADYRYEDWLGFRFGQLKVPHGLYNEYRDIDTLRTFIFLPQSIYPEITRDVTLSLQGIGMYGQIQMYAAGQLSYQFFYGTQAIDGDNNRLSEILSAIPQTFIDNDTADVDAKYVASLMYDTPLTGLRLGASYDNIELTLSGHYNTDSVVFTKGDPVELEFDQFENWVYSLEYTWGDLVLMAEYMDTYRDFENSVAGPGEFEQTGWYAGWTYRLVDWLELGAYYSEMEADIDTNLGSFSMPDYYDELTDICATLRFDFNEYWVFKLEYHNFSGANLLSTWDNPSTSEDSFFTTDNFEEDWTMIAGKLTVAF